MAARIAAGVKPIFDFAVQVFIGAIAFIVVLVAAAAIGTIIKLIEAAGFSPRWFMATAEWGEKILFWTDLFTFALFLLSETAKLMRGLVREWHND